MRRFFYTVCSGMALIAGALSLSACAPHGTATPTPQQVEAGTHTYQHKVIPIDQAPLVIDGCPVNAFFVEVSPNDNRSVQADYSPFTDRVYVAHCQGNTTVSNASICGKACYHSVVTVMPDEPAPASASQTTLPPESPSEMAKTMVQRLNALPEDQRAQVLMTVIKNVTTPSAKVWTETPTPASAPTSP